MKSNAIKRQRGVAAIELALLLVFVLFPILFGITEAGRAMYQYEAITKSARAAARHLMANGASSALVQNEAKCLAVYGLVASSCGGSGWTPIVPNLSTTQVVIGEPSSVAALRNVLTAPGGGVIDIVTVTIGTQNAPYQFESLVPWVFPSVPFAPISAAMPGGF